MFCHSDRREKRFTTAGGWSIRFAFAPQARFLPLVEMTVFQTGDQVPFPVRSAVPPESRLDYKCPSHLPDSSALDQTYVVESRGNDGQGWFVQSLPNTTGTAGSGRCARSPTAA